ncbi:MAG TPA: hypothetical protein VGO37_17155 [Steroidobacteraceae bacterium]|nr:hypothetical protein [Steroidobacteraceae bacterium]
MGTPRSLDATPASTAFGKLVNAAIQMDGISLAAMLAIFIGWFFVDTLVVTLGSLHRGVRFFDISAAIADPTRIFFGVDDSLQRVFFALICLICLLAPLWPHWRRSRLAWASYLAPLALMLLCGTLLYAKTSSEFFPAHGAASPASGVIRFANDLINHASGLVSRHISIGVGGYLAFAGSVALAALGLRRLSRA